MLHGTREHRPHQGRCYAWRPDSDAKVWTRYGKKVVRHPRHGVVLVLAEFKAEGVRRIVWRRTGRL